MKKKEKLKFYDIKKLINMHPDCAYYVVIGERSNGKTYSVLEYMLEQYLLNGYAFAMIRRYDDDIKQDKGTHVFDSLITNYYKENVIEKLSKGKYNSVRYYKRAWYLCFKNEEGVIEEIDQNAFGYAFALTLEEHYKQLQFPTVEFILFDEFITRKYYLVDETITFYNLLSTIIRQKDTIKIFMVANTISKFCPYFREMGLTNIGKMNKGDVDIYSYGDTDLKVAVEFSDFEEKKKKSNKYFAFDNPKLNMIKKGSWEIAIYPHLSREEIKKSDILYTFYICHEQAIIESEIRMASNEIYIYMHYKTTPIQANNKNIVYDLNPSTKWNYRAFITRPQSDLERKILTIIKQKKIFYQDNFLGEIFYNYLKSCIV